MYYSLAALKHLEKLDIFQNDFSDRPPAVLAEMTSLKELHLWKCGLTALPPRLALDCFIKLKSKSCNCDTLIHNSSLSSCMVRLDDCKHVQTRDGGGFRDKVRVS